MACRGAKASVTMIGFTRWTHVRNLPNGNRSIRLCTITLAALMSFTGAQAAADKTDFVIANVRVFDGEKVIPRANVTVEGGRILAVSEGSAIPSGTPVVDGHSKTLIPGLIDAHVHVFPGAAADALRFGVTTELDMFDPGTDLAAWRKKRETLAPTNEADVWAAGIGVTVKGGAPLSGIPEPYRSQFPVLASAADAQAFVDARVHEGSDYIKVFIENRSEYDSGGSLPTLSPEEVCAVIAAAHKDNRLAVTHTQAQWAAREAINCGTDGLAHMIPDSVVGADFLQLAKSHHVFVETTDDVWAAASGKDLAQKLAADPRVAPYLSDSQKSSLLAKDKTIHPAFFPAVLANTRALHDAGVPVLAGTDSPNPGTAHGVSLHEELQILVDAGFSPIAALEAATKLPADTFHIPERGRIAPGYRADLVLIDGDPTRNISDTLSIDRIWMNGQAVDRKLPQRGTNVTDQTK